MQYDAMQLPQRASYNYVHPIVVAVEKMDAVTHIPSKQQAAGVEMDSDEIEG